MSSNLQVELGTGRRVQVHYEGFTIATDQATESGGEGSAPEPFDLFLASIGACAGAYVGGVCRQREIPTDGIRIEQRWVRDEQHRLTHVELVIERPPTFPPKYRAAVVRAAEQCTVKRTLESPPIIETRILAQD